MPAAGGGRMVVEDPGALACLPEQVAREAAADAAGGPPQALHVRRASRPWPTHATWLLPTIGSQADAKVMNTP